MTQKLQTSAVASQVQLWGARIGLNKQSNKWSYVIIEGTNLKDGNSSSTTKVYIWHKNGDRFEGKVHKLLVGSTVAVARVKYVGTASAGSGVPVTSTNNLTVTVENPPNTAAWDQISKESGELYVD